MGRACYIGTIHFGITVSACTLPATAPRHCQERIDVAIRSINIPLGQFFDLPRGIIVTNQAISNMVDLLRFPDCRT